jgi:hypothetical protein
MLMIQDDFEEWMKPQESRRFTGVSNMLAQRLLVEVTQDVDGLDQASELAQRAGETIGAVRWRGVA